MYGKDLIESAALSARICKVIAGPGGDKPPVQSFYEMFLDEQGRKISKSVGRGLTVDTWLSYAPKESMLLFIFKDPRKAKKLSWDVVARSTDEYLQLLQRRYQEAPPGPPPGPSSGDASRDELGFIKPHLPARCPYEYPVNFSMLLGLIGAIGVPSPDVVIDYVHHYKGAMPESDVALEALVNYASAYVQDQILPRRVARTLSGEELRLVGQLADFLQDPREAEEIQTKAFDIAREGGIEPKEFFRILYHVLAGQDSGPRLGTFVKLLGQEKAQAAMRKAIP